MGTIAEKLTYLNTTKIKLRDSLNKFGSSILSTDTFRSYDTKLNEIYDKLPKVTATGQGLTISNVQNGLLDDFKMIGTDLEQNTTTGKNLCGIPNQTFNYNGVDVTIQDGEITLNGTCNSSTVKNIEPVVPIILNGNYTLNIIYIEGTLSGNPNFNIRKADNQEYINGIPLETQNKFKLFNFTSDTSVIYGLYTPNGTVFSNFKMKIQLISGTEADYNFEPYTGGIPSPNPDYPQDIKVVEGRQVITDSSKNLLKPHAMEDTNNGITVSYDEETQVYTFNGTCTQDNTTFMLSNVNINLTANVTKSITYWIGGSCNNYCYMRHYSSGYSLRCTYSISELNENNPKIVTTSQSTFLSPASLNTIRFNNGSVADNFKIKIMVTDDENTDYEPYYEPVSYNIDLQLANIYLAKMPNTDYKNKIYKNNGNWYFEENVKKLILDGTEYWMAVSASDGSRFSCTKIKKSVVIPPSNADVGLIYCDKFSAISSNNTNSSVNGIAIASSGNIVIYYDELKNYGATQFKTWLSNNNLEICYPVTTPTTTQITNTTLINQLEAISVHTGTNIITISNDNNIIPEIEVTRLKELEKLA